MSARQQNLPLKFRGGRRKGAGRPRTRPHPGLDGPGVPHLRRPEFSSRHPILITIRLQPGIGYLRTYRRARELERPFKVARERFGMRIVHYAILGMHLHLIVEAEDAAALSQAMQGLGIRIAKRLNALAGHARENLPSRWDDPCSSARFLRERPGEDAPVAPPRTWLLRVGWREGTVPAPG